MELVDAHAPCISDRSPKRRAFAAELNRSTSSPNKVKSKCVVYRSDRRVTAAGQAVNAAGSSCSSLGSVWLRERANT
ncbi:hypothetical protein, partial [Nocardia puris]|uniref:hypothetical protein n=1 Tax=Nocardia puris TaxID=208602 RepID=UPI001E2C2781